MAGLPRFVPNDSQSVSTVSAEETNKNLIEILTSTVEKFPPRDEWSTRDGENVPVGGLYCGPTGIAYLFMNIAKKQPNLLVKDRLPLEWVSLYLSGHRSPEPPTPTNCGMLNEDLAYNAISASFRQDLTYVQRLVDYIGPLVSSSDGWWEYCFGRTGLLYYLRLTRTWFPESATLINPAIKSVIEAILANGPPWLYRQGVDLVGLGHGRMGTIVQILLTDPSYAPQVEPILVDILALQTPDGNWPRRHPTSSKDERTDIVVQWCHGAAGMVQGLSAIRHLYPHLHSQIDLAIENGRKITWERGLLTKEPNLCHGITGNAFAFPPGEKRDHFLTYTTEEKVKRGLEDGTFEKCDYGLPWSLGLGKVGRAVGWLWRERECGNGYMAFDDI